MLPSDIRNLQEAYENIYKESDILTDDLIEEIVEELVEECLEFGYDLDESVAAVEEAAILYMDEAKVTYGSDTESPEQRRERAKAKVDEKKSAARQAAVKSAVSKVKSKAAGAAISAYAAGKAAKSAVSGAVSAVKKAPAAVSAAAKQKKAEVKSGVKSLIGRGLRKAAGAVGKVAQRAAGAASRLGEEYIDEAITSEKGKAKAAEMIAKRSTPSGRAKSGQGANVAQIKHIGRANVENLSGTPATPTIAKNPVKSRSYGGTGNKAARRAGLTPTREKPNAWKEEFDIFDLILEYLISEGHADTIAEAEYIMTQMDSEMIENILEDSSTLAAAARKRAQEMGAKRRRTPAYKAGGNRGTGRNERAAYNLSNTQRSAAANPDTQTTRSKKPSTMDTGMHSGDYDRYNRKDPKKNPKHNANK